MAGYANGQVVCYTPSNDKPKESKPVTETRTETKDNGDGTSTTTTTTTTTQTTCSGGSCNTTRNTSTTTTVTNNTTNQTISNTTQTGSETGTDALSEFCKKNPKSALCSGDSGDDGGKSQFGGSCSAGFQCKGDAIQCAMARDQHQRHCQAYDPQGTPEEALYESSKGVEGNVTGDNPNNSEISAGSALDMSDAIGAGGGSGLSDLTITVFRKSITLPMSKVNSSLVILGNLLVAVSLIIAFRIVSRG